MSSCIQEAFLLKDLSSSLSLYLSFCVSLSSSWSPPDEPWCSPRSDDVWYVSGSAQIAEMWLFIDDRLTGWRRRRRRREKATVRSAPDGSDNKRAQREKRSKKSVAAEKMQAAGKSCAKATTVKSCELSSTKSSTNKIWSEFPSDTSQICSCS